jgi:hypothetical protein
MAISGIEAAVDRTVQRLSPDARVQEDVKAAFLDLFEELFDRLTAAQQGARGPAAPAAAVGPTTLYSLEQPGAAAVRTRDVVGSGVISLLKEPDLPPLELLSMDLAAGDPQYNQREAMLRERLDLGALEQRLRSLADSHGVTYNSEDLAGVLRNAGYDAVHLGSTERYMAAVERLIGYAEDRYRAGASNVPGAA